MKICSEPLRSWLFQTELRGLGHDSRVRLPSRIAPRIVRISSSTRHAPVAAGRRNPEPLPAYSRSSNELSSARERSNHLDRAGELGLGVVIVPGTGFSAKSR